MYDNINFILNNNQCSGVNFLQETPQFLTYVSHQGVNNYGEYVIGYLDSLKVSISDNSVKIYNSSICKYFLGDNFKTLSKGDTKKAVEKISDCLHLPFHLANITRIDFAQNLILQYPEKIYYPYLGEAQYYNRLEQNNGLYYNNHLRQLVFYGKEYEQKVKRQPIPELYRNKNVLRFELRYKKRLRQQFKRPAITASLLYDEVFYRDLVTRWKNEYLAIQKIKSKLINMQPTSSTRVLIENMALFQILEIGQLNILSIIKEWQGKGLITKKQANDHRNKIKLLSKRTVDEKENDLINELNQKIKEAARY